MNKVYLIGDSTCHTNKDDTYPQCGWGQFFNEYLLDTFEVINLSENGRSSKSFYDEGLFKSCEENIEEGDYLFIQFGHNDEKDDEARHTDPFSSYQKYLKYYIDIARKNKATPILLSSIYRRKFENGKLIENTHGDYPLAMKKLANKENVIFIDLCELTKNELNKLGEEKSRDLFMNFRAGLYKNYPEGKEDNTHLREKGARFVLNLLVNEIKKIDLLNQILK